MWPQRHGVAPAVELSTVGPSALEAGQGTSSSPSRWILLLRPILLVFTKRQNTTPETPAEPDGGGDTELPQYMERIGIYRRGYPMLSAFMNLDPAFMMCRSFGILHTRVLLYKQDELSELEERLNELDQNESKKSHLTSRRRGDENTDRCKLMDDIAKKIEEYDKILQSQHFLSRLPLTNKRNFKSYSNWMDRIAPLSEPEDNFLQYREDFVTLTPKGDQGWLESSLEHFIDRLPSSIRKFFSPDNQNLQTEDPTLHIFRRQRVGSFVRYLNATFAVTLLVPPVVILHQMRKDLVEKYGLIVLVGFTWLFSISMSMFTKARKHEVFAATAAYCAVLVVFFGSAL